MSARLPLPRVWILVALVCALLVLPLALQRVTASASSTRVAVIGDSISARYNDRAGNANQAWWSFVGRRYDADVKIFAQSGSGFGRPGDRCKGSIFGERLKAVKKYRPQVVFVEGGRNDWSYCKNGKLRTTSNKQVRKSVDTFLAKLKKSMPVGTRIYVLGPPWGPLQAAEGRRVTKIIKASAKQHRLLYVDTKGVFTRNRVKDGVHPNRAGSRALGIRVIRTIGPTLPVTTGTR